MNNGPPNMLKYDPSSPLVSLHIPKTGGTSLRKLLEFWFPDGHLKLHYRDGDLKPQKHSLAAGDCVHGHFNGARGIGVLEYYPEVKQYIAFLRDPFDRFVSQWHYLNKMKALGLSVPALDAVPDFDFWLNKRAEEQQSGENSFSFLCHFPVKNVNFEEIKAVVHGNFICLGIMEYFEESAAQLALSLGKKSLELPHENARAVGVDDYSAWRNIYEVKFITEYEVYNLAKELLFSKKNSL